MAFVHSPKIVTDGLVLALDAGNVKSYPGSGTTWLDKSGRGNNGTLTNGPTFNSGNGGSIVFDGVNDYVDCGNILNSLTNITISTWIKDPSVIGIYEGVVDKGRDNYGAWSLAVNETPTRATFKCRISGTNRGITTTSNYTLNTWIHIVGTFDGSILAIYQNGLLNNLASYPGTMGTNSLSIILGSTNDNYHFSGNMAGVQIYNRALSASEVLQNYNATKGRFGL